MSKKIIPWLLLAAGGAGMLLTGCTGVTPTAASSQSIIGGTTESGDPAVVLLVATIGNSGQAYCTAEVVSPHVVMTAAHCVDPSELGGTATFQVFLGDDVNGSQGNDSSLYLDVSTTHFNSQFDGNQVENGHDVGVAILSTAAPVTPIPMNTTALTSAQNGKPLRLVGYGITSANDQGGSSAGTKRQVTASLADYDDLFVDFENGTCEGDSGGPAFMTIGGTEVIVGITSFGPQTCNGMSTDTRVDTIAGPFINTYVQQADPGWMPGSTSGTTGSTSGTTGSSTGGTTGSSTGSTSGTTGSTGGTTGSSTGGTTGSSTGSTSGTTGSSTGSTTGSSGSTGGTGGTTGSSTGGTTGSNGCSPSVKSSCPTNEVCVMANGVGQCILAPTPVLQDSKQSGCSVGGNGAQPAPLVLMLFAVGFLVRRKLWV